MEAVLQVASFYGRSDTLYLLIEIPHVADHRVIARNDDHHCKRYTADTKHIFTPYVLIHISDVCYIQKVRNQIDWFDICMPIYSRSQSCYKCSDLVKLQRAQLLQYSRYGGIGANDSDKCLRQTPQEGHPR